MSGWVCGAIAAVVAVVIAPVVLLILWHNVRVWRLRREYKRLPAEVKNRILHAIQKAAADQPAVTFHRLDAERTFDSDELPLSSHVGGVPYAEAGDAWPADSRFLLQVRLTEPSLGEVWQGRLIAVFLVFDAEQVVRSYAAPAVDKYVALSADQPYPCVPLTAIRMPMRSGDNGDENERGKFPASVRQLVAMLPAIKEALARFTNDPEGMLAQILHPAIYGYDLDAPDMAYEGGEPMLIQQPHDARCNECGKPMRFLFQFGEIIPDLQMADAGVAYIYGCDEHPHLCKGFIDSH